MKILNPYRFFKGAFGSGTDAPTPKLIPPREKNGLLKSISIFECVDLLCEGPIYGLVDQFGKKIYERVLGEEYYGTLVIWRLLDASGKSLKIVVDERKI